MKRIGPVAILGLVLALASPPGHAGAAPVSRPADLTLDLHLFGVGSLYMHTPYSYYVGASGLEISLSGSGTVSVDATAGTIALGPGVLSQTDPVEWIVTGTTAIDSIEIFGFSHGAGLFSVGGAGGHPGEPPCPLVAPGACVAQTGFGGTMALTGTYEVHVVPDVVVIPVALGGFGTAGQATTPFTYDYAPWTIGTAQALSSGITTQGGLTASGFRLVSPTYVQPLGNQLPFFASLTVTFTDGLGLPGFVAGQVPEPATWLLAAGAAGLGLALLRKG